jgi:hypothetical protein
MSGSRTGALKCGLAKLFLLSMYVRSINLNKLNVYRQGEFYEDGITSVTGGEKCHSGGILFQSSTVLSRNKMLSDMTGVVVHQ